MSWRSTMSYKSITCLENDFIKCLYLITTILKHQNEIQNNEKTKFHYYQISIMCLKSSKNKAIKNFLISYQTLNLLILIIILPKTQLMYWKYMPKPYSKQQVEVFHLLYTVEA